MCGICRILRFYKAPFELITFQTFSMEIFIQYVAYVNYQESKKKCCRRTDSCHEIGKCQTVIFFYIQQNEFPHVLFMHFGIVFPSCR